MLESDLGSGSRFSVRFPANTLLQEQGSEATETNPALPENTPVVEVKQLPKVLLVDDDDMCIILATQMLRDIVEVEYAATGEDGVLLLTNNSYAAVLLDINLKTGMSGFDVLNKIKEMPKYNDIAVIAVTAYAMMGDKEVFLSQGFTDYISKPFTGSKLCSVVKKWILRQD